MHLFTIYVTEQAAQRQHVHLYDCRAATVYIYITYRYIVIDTYVLYLYVTEQAAQPQHVHLYDCRATQSQVEFFYIHTRTHEHTHTHITHTQHTTHTHTFSIRWFSVNLTPASTDYRVEPQH